VARQWWIDWARADCPAVQWGVFGAAAATATATAYNNNNNNNNNNKNKTVKLFMC
jgi:hypothetical protein